MFFNPHIFPYKPPLKTIDSLTVRVFLVLLAVFLCVPKTYALDINRAKAALEEGLYSRAYNDFVVLADENNGEAQYYIGKMYEEGKGLPKSRTRALDWYIKAAQVGDFSQAQLELAKRYEKGQGVGQDDDEAFRWYLKAAHQGELSAQKEVGKRYFSGKGVEVNFREALDWFKKAAQDGDAYSQFQLGEMYIKGQATLPNFTEANRWYRLAANQGYQEAQAKMRQIYGTNIASFDDKEKVGIEKVNPFTGELLEENASSSPYEQDVTPAKLDDYIKAGKQGDVAAQNSLGRYFLNNGIQQDYRQALYWLRLATRQQSADSQYRLGLIYTNGYGVARNDTEAVRWFAQAAQQGHIEAQYILGLYYASGRGVTTDYIKAHAWLSMAESQRLTKAKRLIVRIKNNMTSVEVTQAKRIALSCVTSKYKRCPTL